MRVSLSSLFSAQGMDFCAWIMILKWNHVYIAVQHEETKENPLE
jgi:hypothetical protein